MKKQKRLETPEWVKTFGQTPLEIKIKGKLYEHDVICSASRKFPKGGPGCGCLRRLANVK